MGRRQPLRGDDDRRTLARVGQLALPPVGLARYWGGGRDSPAPARPNNLHSTLFVTDWQQAAARTWGEGRTSRFSDGVKRATRERDNMIYTELGGAHLHALILVVSSCFI